MWEEVAAYGTLMALFFTNSLLLGFTVYFVFWHSLSSTHDQLRFFRRRLTPGLRRRLLIQIGGTVLGALGGCLILWFSAGPGAVLQPRIVGGLFIGISLLTLPHMILVEQLYSKWSPASPVPPEYRKQDSEIPIPLTSPQSVVDRPVANQLTITH